MKSLQKALKILECFNSKTAELGITEISRLLGLNKSNVHSIVATFELGGYLVKNSQTGKYRLGLKLLEFSYIINETLGYQRAVYGILKKVADQVNTVVYFAIPKQTEVLYISNVYPSSQGDVPYRSIMGEKAPMYCTSLGKVMLAFMPPEAAQNAMAVPMIKYTDATITDAGQLEREIETIRATGYGLDRMEHEYGIYCIGVPVFKNDGAFFGAISISGSPSYFTAANSEFFIAKLKEAAFLLRERF